MIERAVTNADQLQIGDHIRLRENDTITDATVTQKGPKRITAEPFGAGKRIFLDAHQQAWHTRDIRAVFPTCHDLPLHHVHAQALIRRHPAWNLLAHQTVEAISPIDSIMVIKLDLVRSKITTLFAKRPEPLNGAVLAMMDEVIEAQCTAEATERARTFLAKIKPPETPLSGYTLVSAGPPFDPVLRGVVRTPKDDLATFVREAFDLGVGESVHHRPLHTGELALYRP